MNWRRMDPYHVELTCGRMHTDGQTCRGRLCGKRACGLYTITRGGPSDAPVFTAWCRDKPMGRALCYSADKRECAAAVRADRADNRAAA